MSITNSHHPALSRNGLNSLTDIDLRDALSITKAVVIVDVGMRLERVAGITLVPPEELARRTLHIPVVLYSKNRDDYDFMCFCDSIPTWRAGNGWSSHLNSKKHVGTYLVSVLYVFVGAAKLIDLI